MTCSDPGGPTRAPQSPDAPHAPTAPDSPAEVADAKAVLRADALRRRAARTPDPAADAARLDRALAACAGHTAVACYASVGAEPDTRALIDALAARGVRVLLPVLAGRRTPAWAWYAGPDALRPGFRGIPEPMGPALGPEALAEVTFVWASALLVARDGVRLGTGGGWYDRALALATPDATVAVLVGDDEVTDALPRDQWDVPVDLVVTPAATLATGAPGRRAGASGRGIGHDVPGVDLPPTRPS